MTTTVKTCFKCGDEKPLTEYYRHSRMADGHLNKCKECTKRDVRHHRRNPKYRQHVLAYDRRRGNRQPRHYLKHYRLAYPGKYRAVVAVGNALRDGRLDKADACEKCGNTEHLHGHHDDYMKPLDVRWLCAACHRQWHSGHGEAANPF